MGHISNVLPKKQFIFVLCFTLILGLCAVAILFYRAGFSASFFSPSVSDENFLELAVKEQGIPAKPEGWLVFQRPEGIFKGHSRGKEAQLLATNGRYPRWSPDGRFIAFIRGSNIMLMKSDGSKMRSIAEGRNIRAVCFHPRGRKLLYIDADRVQSVRIKDGRINTLLTNHDFRELDIANDGKSLVATVKTLLGFQVKFFSLDSNNSTTIGRGCSATTSPNGNYVTINGAQHRELLLYHLDSKSLVHKLQSPPGTSFDNHYWTNHPAWLVSSVDQQGMNIFLHHVKSGTFYQLTSFGDCDRGDFFVSK